MLGKSPLKWGQRPDMTLAVDCEVKHQLEKANIKPVQSLIRTTSVYDVALNTPLQSVLAVDLI